MSENTDIKFLTPINPVRHRPSRLCKEQANEKLVKGYNYNISPPKTTRSKVTKTASFLSKENVIRRVKSQVISKSNAREVVELERKFRKSITLDSDEDEHVTDSSESDSEFSDESESSEYSSLESVDMEDLCDKPSGRASAIKRSKSLANPRRSISVPIRISKVCDANAETRERLHVGSIPDDFPCRDKEWDNICTFLQNHLCKGVNGCMFISGMPGTGKTATVTSVIDFLESENADMPAFRKVMVNGMHVADPQQVYSLIYQELTGRRTTMKHAPSALEKELFVGNKSRIPTLILIDEIDQLCSKKQDVLYKIFNWLGHKGSKLVLVTISNTMDLAERVLHNKVSSRLGMTRLPFEPYTPQQLIEIISARLTDEEMKARFELEAVQLAAKKVAAMSGDARRALDICRRAIELQRAEKKIDVSAVNSVIKEMYSSPYIAHISRGCSFYEKIFLKAIVTTFMKTGLDEASLQSVMVYFANECESKGVSVPNLTEIFGILTSLSSYRLLAYDSIKNDIRLQIRLVCSKNDVLFAFDK